MDIELRRCYILRGSVCTKELFIESERAICATVPVHGLGTLTNDNMITKPSHVGSNTNNQNDYTGAFTKEFYGLTKSACHFA
jgi:hypothetical protein